MTKFSRKYLLSNRNNNKQYQHWFSAGFNSRFSAGLTLIELLIVLAIVSLLILLFFSSSSIYIGRARDSERKSDLEKIKVAFEDYYNDNECYPPAGVLSDCDGTSLSPYLSSIPCDPSSNDPYKYYALQGNNCGGFRVLTSLYDKNDTAVLQLNCDETLGCDPNTAPEVYNYGVSAGGITGNNSYWMLLETEQQWICTSSDGVCSVGNVPSGCVGYDDGDTCSASCDAAALDACTN